MEPVSSFESLLSLITSRKLTKLNKSIELYSCCKEGRLSAIKQDRSSTEMRLIVLGKLCTHGQVWVSGFGFGWDANIFYDKQMVKEEGLGVGVVSEGVDFEKSFYQVT